MGGVAHEAWAHMAGQVEKKYRYLVMGRKAGEALTLIEYRTDLRGREAPTQKLSKEYVKTTGFAAMPLFFGPFEQPWSDFRLLGQQRMAGCRTAPPLNPLLNEEGIKGWCGATAGHPLLA